ncbi:MAG: hypothetical protein ABJB47_11015 [Actinomycetota bacterium]
MSSNGKDDGQDQDLAGMAVEVGSNQVREEPIPASHHEDKDQAGVAQNEESWRRSAQHDQGDADEAGRDEAGRAAPAQGSQGPRAGGD